MAAVFETELKVSNVVFVIRAQYNVSLIETNLSFLVMQQQTA